MSDYDVNKVHEITNSTETIHSNTPRDGLNFCYQCGQPWIAESKYCTHCGASGVRDYRDPLDVYDVGYIGMFKRCIMKKFAEAKGRASRSEYWRFQLGIWVFFNVVTLLVIALCLDFKSEEAVVYIFSTFNIVTNLASIVLMIPSITLSIRRLHDVGKSGWTLLWGLVPLFGSLYILYLFCKKGTDEVNHFGWRTSYIPVTRELAVKLGVDETPKSSLTMCIIIGLVFSWIVGAYMGILLTNFI